MAGSLLYVNARIKALENGLLNQLQLSRLVEAENLTEAFKVLQECGYGAGFQIDDARSCENMIAEKENQASAFLRENLFKNSGLDMFLVKNDYHNAKVLIKAKYLRLKNVDDMAAPDGMLSKDAMQTDVFNDVYDKLPREMADALREIDVAFAEGNRSPRLIDTKLDRAMFDHIHRIVAAARKKPLTDYFTAWADTINIATFIRSRSIGADVVFFDEAFVPHGTLDREFFDGLFDASDERFKEKMKYTPYAELTSKAYESDGLVRFETAADNYLLGIFKSLKYDMFSVASIAGFYLGQLTEIKAVKLVVSCIKNNVDNKLLKLRLRELYA